MINILTYNVKHRKTYDVLCLLKSIGYEDVHVYATPLHYVKKFVPLIEHRPKLNMNIPTTNVICKNFNYLYTEGQLEDFDIPQDEIILVCGAGILPDHFVKSHRIINSHPGYIPNCRGLDALKWAIYEGQPIGVTTHLIGDYIDAGYVIDRRIIPIYKNDTFHALSQRVYENEIDMLVEAINKIDDKLEFIEPGTYEVHKRMPHSYEAVLLSKFDDIKNNGI